MNKTLGFGLLVLGIGLSLEAEAACRWAYVNGRQQQLCDSAIDLPAIGAPGIAPIAPPAVPPIQTPTIPPIGTSTCYPAQVWNGYGYQWQIVCR